MASWRDRYCPSRSSRARTLISPRRLCFSSIVNGRLEASKVRQPPGLARVDRGDLKFFGNLLALIDHALEKSVHVVNQGIELDAGFDDFLAGLDAADQIRLGLRDGHQPRPVLPLADDTCRAIGELEHLEDQADAHHREQVVFAGRVGLGMNLAHEADHAFADHAVVDQPDAARPVDHQRHDRLRENHVGTERQEGDITRQKRLTRVPLAQDDELPRLRLRPAGLGDRGVNVPPTLPWTLRPFST